LSLDVLDEVMRETMDGLAIALVLLTKQNEHKQIIGCNWQMILIRYFQSVELYIHPGYGPPDKTSHNFEFFSSSSTPDQLIYPTLIKLKISNGYDIYDEWPTQCYAGPNSALCHFQNIEH
jgi:hypothetical protein